jgi:hypothetical protein
LSTYNEDFIFIDIERVRVVDSFIFYFDAIHVHITMQEPSYLGIITLVSMSFRNDMDPKNN